MSNIFIQYITWYYVDQIKFLLKVWRNFFKFGLNYFSIPLLLKTLCSPWRRYSWEYPRGFGFQGYLEVAASNFISRAVGALMRIILIFAGILTEIVIFFFGLMLLIGWVFLPAALLIGLWFGLKLIF